MPSVKSLEQAPSNKPQRAPLFVLFLTVFVDLLGFGIVIPFLPIYAQRLNVGAASVGLILSAYSLMQFVCAPILGRISDRVGRRPVIMLGLLGSSLSYVIYGFADSFSGLLVSRAVHGACAATISTAMAYVADTTGETERAHGMGMIGAAFGLGFVLGPALGGLLGHSSLRTPVFAAAALTFANLIFAAMALPESHPISTRSHLQWSGLLKPASILPYQLTRHRLSPLFWVAFLGTFAMAGFETTFALMARQLHGYGAYGVGGLLAFAGIVQAFTQGYLIRKCVPRSGELNLIRGGLIAFAFGMAPMASFVSPVMLLVTLALLSLGYGFVSPSVASLISKCSEGHQQGEVLGLNQSALALARICGPIAGGVVYQRLGAPAAYFGGGLVAIIALLPTLGIEPAPEAPKGRPSR
ncbi:MAG TPA: MFS transporter [Candidatus Binataceae bacterium]|nr:MFS transporter [Candidatus Binataceae bacterium]